MGIPLSLVTAARFSKADSITLSHIGPLFILFFKSQKIDNSVNISEIIINILYTLKIDC